MKNLELIHLTNMEANSLVPKLRFKDEDGKDFPEWEEKQLGEILSIASGRDYKNLGKGDIPVYGTGGLMTRVDKYLYEGDSVGIGRKGTIDKPVMLRGKFWTVDTLFYTHNFKNSTPKFVFYLFQRIVWYRYNEASGVPSLSKKTIEKILKPFPSYSEQCKIAEFLSNIDKKINLLTKKKALLESYKKGVMQKIFSQEIRFKDDGKAFPDWEEIKLGKLLEEYKKKSKVDNEYPMLTSSNKGLMLQSDYYGENRLTARSSLGYNIIPVGYLTYRSRSDNSRFTFNLNNLGFTGLISTYYPVFKMTNCNNYFILSLLNNNKNHIDKTVCDVPTLNLPI